MRYSAYLFFFGKLSPLISKESARGVARYTACRNSTLLSYRACTITYRITHGGLLDVG